MHRLSVFTIVCLCAALAGGLTAVNAAATRCVSLGVNGALANADVSDCALSGNGRYVAFVSDANNLVPGDTNNLNDVFVRDRTTGVTERVSVSSDELQGNAPSWEPSISADGRYVVFTSQATNLVPNDSPFFDIFLRDRTAGTTIRLSQNQSDVNANWSSSKPAISADGRFVVFVSGASNLVTGDNNSKSDIFRVELSTSTIIMVSLASDAEQTNADCNYPFISADGRYVVFTSGLTNWQWPDSSNGDDVFLRDCTMNTTMLISIVSGHSCNSFCRYPTVSADGRFVAFVSGASDLVPGDTNGALDVFVRDTSFGTIQRVSVSSLGEQGWGQSERARISRNGRYVAFSSQASNLVPEDTNYYSDIFVRDRTGNTTKRLSVGLNGADPSAESEIPSISDNGTVVAFVSDADNLIPNDSNTFRDAFVRDPNGPSITAKSPKGTNVGLRPLITITFDMAMDKLSVKKNFVITPTVAGTFSWDGRKFIFTPGAALAASTRYVVKMKAGARSSAGVTLGEVFKWGFTTRAAAAAPLMLTAATAPRPSGGAELRLQLNAPAQVEVTVLNVAGRVVRTLGTTAEVSGSQIIVWDGRSSTGSVAPAGQYLLRVTARAADGTSTQAVAAVALAP